MSARLCLLPEINVLGRRTVDGGGDERRENTGEARDCGDPTEDRFRESTESPNNSSVLLLYCRRKEKNNQKDEGGKRKRES